MQLQTVNGILRAVNKHIEKDQEIASLKKMVEQF